jgi:hypothetical protein
MAQGLVPLRLTSRTSLRVSQLQDLGVLVFTLFWMSGVPDISIFFQK